MSSYLQKRIMRRVYVMWTLRQVLSSASLKMMIILASLWQIKSAVFVRAVFENMPSVTDVVSNINFFASALVNTQFSVQLSILTAAILAVWLVKDAKENQLGYWF